ncbi:MAG: LytTR family DNA-binding domain-containing protein [Cyclobacteriaceae bacterium]|jgi:DNA-binding LytR/AlgR family response regulator|nr:LytTR family DNA-binding domain-containing protein [Cyclobacteriaceae bacterium]
MKLNCLIVDDEPVARKGIAEYVNEIEYLNLVGQCENSLKAGTYLAQQPVDLIYLDIHMPKLSGIEFLKTLRDPPLIILTTAYSDYAVEGYALDIVDYLVKPIAFERFLKATQKALEITRLRKIVSGKAREVDYFFIKCDNKYEKVFYDQVLFIEALQNYVVIHTRDRKMITYITLTGLEQQLPPDLFLKVHKSYIVGITHVRALDANEILIGNDRIPISRALKESVVSRIMGNKLFRR